MMWRYKQFMQDCQRVMPVDTRISLRVRPRILYRGDACDGLTHFLPTYRVLELDPKPTRGFWSVFAHEWVHLHVFEVYGREEPDHGNVFQLNAAALEYRLKRMGWRLKTPVYHEKLDK